MKHIALPALLTLFYSIPAHAHPFVIPPPAKDYAGQIVKPPKNFSDALAIASPREKRTVTPSQYQAQLNAFLMKYWLFRSPILHLRESWLTERQNKIDRTRAAFLRRSPKRSLLKASWSPLPNLTAFKERPSFQDLLSGRVVSRSLLGFAF